MTSKCCISKCNSSCINNCISSVPVIFLRFFTFLFFFTALFSFKCYPSSSLSMHSPSARYSFLSTISQAHCKKVAPGEDRTRDLGVPQ